MTILYTMGKITDILIRTKRIDLNRSTLLVGQLMTITVIAHLLQALIGWYTGNIIDILHGFNKPFDITTTLSITLGEFQNSLLRTVLMTEITIKLTIIDSDATMVFIFHLIEVILSQIGISFQFEFQFPRLTAITMLLYGVGFLLIGLT